MKFFSPSSDEFLEHRERLTPVKQGESVKRSLARTDPVYFVVNQLGIRPYAWQAKFLDELRLGKNVIACTARQVGKTAAIAWFCLWSIVYNTLPLESTKKTRGIIVSATEEQSKKIVSDVKEFMRVGDEQVFKLTGGKVKDWFTNQFDHSQSATNTKSGITLLNGCTLISLPPTERARGYCLCEGTMIQTDDGEKRIETLKKGDCVQTVENLTTKFSTVGELVDNGVRPCYLVKTETGKEVVCTLNHPFLCLEDNEARNKVGWNNTPYWKTAGAIKQSLEELEHIKNVRVAVPEMLHTDSKLGSVPDECWWMLGAMVGDGCVAAGKCEFINTNKQILERFTKGLRSGVGDYSVFEDKRFNRVAGVRVLNNSWFKKFVESHGLVDKRSWEKTVPEVVFTLTKEEIAYFLAGLWSTDGWVCVGDKRVDSTFCTSSPELAKGVQRLLMRFGIRSNLRFRVQGKKNIWWVQIRSKKYNKLFNESVVITGKEEKQKEVLSFCDGKMNQADTNKTFDVFWEKVVSVEPVGERQTYDISVEGTHCMVSNGVITHNTGSFLFIDEAAFIEEADIYESTLQPIVSKTGGFIGMTSTPNGRSGFFFNYFDPDDGQDHHTFSRLWVPYQSLRHDDSKIVEDRDEKKRVAELHGNERQFMQEHEASFNSSVTSFFDPDVVDKCTRKTLQFVEGYDKPCDLAVDFGKTTSRTVVSISGLRRDSSGDVIVLLYHYEYPPEADLKLVEDLQGLYGRFNIQRMIFEDCPQAEAHRQAALQAGLPVVMFNPSRDKSRKYFAFRSWMSQGKVVFPEQQGLVKQMKGMIQEDTQRTTRIYHGPGLRDDRVDSFMMSTSFFTEEKPKFRVWSVEE